MSNLVSHFHLLPTLIPRLQIQILRHTAFATTPLTSNSLLSCTHNLRYSDRYITLLPCLIIYYPLLPMFLLRLQLTDLLTEWLCLTDWLTDSNQLTDLLVLTNWLNDSPTMPNGLTDWLTLPDLLADWLCPTHILTGWIWLTYLLPDSWRLTLFGRWRPPLGSLLVCVYPVG